MKYIKISSISIAVILIFIISYIFISFNKLTLLEANIKIEKETSIIEVETGRSFNQTILTYEFTIKNDSRLKIGSVKYPIYLEIIPQDKLNSSIDNNFFNDRIGYSMVNSLSAGDTGTYIIKFDTSNINNFDNNELEYYLDKFSYITINLKIKNFVIYSKELNNDSFK